MKLSKKAKLSRFILDDSDASIIDKSYVIEENQAKKPVVTLSNCSRCNRLGFSVTAE